MIGILVYRADYKCSLSIAMPAEQWSDDVGLSRGLSAGLAASGALMCGHTSRRLGWGRHYDLPAP